MYNLYSSSKDFIKSNIKYVTKLSSKLYRNKSSKGSISNRNKNKSIKQNTNNLLANNRSKLIDKIHSCISHKTTDDQIDSKKNCIYVVKHGNVVS